MEKRGKVNKLVKKFNSKPIMKHESSMNIIKQDQNKSEKDNNNVEQDEISVTIDIGEEEVLNPAKPLVKTRSKKNISQNSESDVSKFLNQPNTQKQDSNTSLNQINPPFQAKKTMKEINANDASQLSPWLSDKINNNSHETQNTRYRTIATDTFELKRRQDEEIRLMKERIDDLECQSKIKDREIETIKWIENEMQRRLQTAGDHFTLKQQVKDLQRNLDLQERLNQDLTNDNVKLYDEMSMKERKILELQSEVNNLDKIIANKDFICESEFNQKMINQIDEVQRDLMEKEVKLKENEQQINELTREIERKDNELQIKNMKLDEALSDYKRHEHDYINQERKHFAVLESLKSKERENEALVQNVRKYDDIEKKWKSLEDENLFLKNSIHELEDQCKNFEKYQNTKADINSVLEEMSDIMIDKNRLNEENMNLSEQLRLAESLLKEKSVEEIALQKENSQLKTFIIDLEEEISLYRKFESEVNELDVQLRESERSRNALENQIIQLKPQIQKLQVKSLEKDHLITELVHELKSQIGHIPADLRKEISKNEIKENENLI